VPDPVVFRCALLQSLQDKCTRISLHSITEEHQKLLFDKVSCSFAGVLVVSGSHRTMRSHRCGTLCPAATRYVTVHLVQRIGKSARLTLFPQTCPLCNSKCSKGKHSDGVKHECTHHVLPAFGGWRSSTTREATLHSCTSSLSQRCHWYTPKTNVSNEQCCVTLPAEYKFTD
jgi:hypothetical protein